MIGILVVDDHPIVREGLIAILQEQPDFRITGAAGSAEEAVAVAAASGPDVVLLDLELPDQSGVETIPRLLEAWPRARVLVFTAYQTDERVFGAIRAGARGYLLKGAPADEIGRAIRTVYAGGSHLEPQIAAKLVQALAARQDGAPATLTDREREVLALLYRGSSNKRIARTLGVTERTAKFHVSSILQKLGAENRTEAVALAVQRGLL